MSKFWATLIFYHLSDIDLICLSPKCQHQLGKTFMGLYEFTKYDGEVKILAISKFFEHIKMHVYYHDPKHLLFWEFIVFFSKSSNTYINVKIITFSWYINCRYWEAQNCPQVDTSCICHQKKIKLSTLKSTKIVS